MINKLKNWWFQIVGVIVIILDQGFEVINPLLVEMGLPSKYFGIIKLLFGFYMIYKSKKELPTQNIEKLQDIVEKKGLTEDNTTLK